MEISEKEAEIIINCGVFEYDTRRISNVLDKDFETVKNQMQDHNSKLYKLYMQGIDKADYVLDLKLFEMAQTGDISAIEKLESRKRDRKDFLDFSDI